MKEFRKSNFVIDSIPDAMFEGYTNGDLWNGWACPYFERTEAERVLHYSEANGFRWRYDETQDAYAVSDENTNSEPELFQATTINVDREEIITYPVGAYCWIWETPD